MWHRSQVTEAGCSRDQTELEVVAISGSWQLVREGRERKAGKAIGELGGGKGVVEGEFCFERYAGCANWLAVTEGIATWHVF